MAQQSGKSVKKEDNKTLKKQNKSNKSVNNSTSKQPKKRTFNKPTKNQVKPTQANETKRKTNTKRNPAKKAKKESQKNTLPLRIIPLGGLHEIGKNITLYEYGNDMLLVDCGMSFPDEDLPGVDIVLPDFSYLVKNKDKIRGMVVSHGHEDHIGGIPYLLKELNIPIYGTRLTIGLISGKLKEHNLLASSKLVAVNTGDVIKLGGFSVEFIHVNH